jgi:hypothetical protein
MKSENTFIDKLFYISRYLFPLSDEILLEKLKDGFLQEIKNIPKNSSYKKYKKLVDIYLSFHECAEIGGFTSFLENLITESDSIDSLLETARLKDIDKVVKNGSIIKNINEIARDDFNNVDRGSYEYTRDFMLEVSDYFNVYLSQYIDELDERIDTKKNSEDRVDVHKSLRTDNSEHDENKKIKELFDTLLLK